MHDEAGMLGQPLLNVGMLMGGVVVHDQVQLQVFARAAVDQTQELEPLLMPMPLLAHRNDRAVQRVERGKQRGRAVAFVVVGHGAGAPELHWQARLGAVERLDLALLVATEHERLVGRIEVQAHDVDQLVLEARVARELEGVLQMRLEAVALPYAPDRCGAQIKMRRQRARAPVRGRGRLLVQRRVVSRATEFSPVW